MSRAEYADGARTVTDSKPPSSSVRGLCTSNWRLTFLSSFCTCSIAGRFEESKSRKYVSRQRYRSFSNVDMPGLRAVLQAVSGTVWRLTSHLGTTKRPSVCPKDPAGQSDDNR